MTAAPAGVEWDCFHHHGAPVESDLEGAVCVGDYLVRDSGDGDMFPDSVVDAPFTGVDVCLDIISMDDHVLLGKVHLQLFDFSRGIHAADFIYCCDSVDQPTYDMSEDVVASGVPLKKGLLVVRGFEVSPTQRKRGVGKGMLAAAVDYMRQHRHYAKAFSRVQRVALHLYTDASFDQNVVNRMVAVAKEQLPTHVKIKTVRMTEALLRKAG